MNVALPPTPETLAELLEQERELQFSLFDNALAWELGQRLVAAARDGGHAVTIDIRRGEQQLFHAAAAEGTSADDDARIERKAAVVRRFGHSSLYAGVDCALAGQSPEERHRLDPRRYSALGGAFPISVRGVGMVGTVTVSGLAPVADHQLVVSVLREFIGENTRP